MAYTSIDTILASERFEEFIESFVDDYGMGFVSELDPDKAVYSMDDFNDIFHGMTPWDIMCRVYFGDMHLNDDYFTFNGYGNIETISEYSLHDYLWDIIRYDSDKFHEYLMDYYPEDYQAKFEENFPLLEEKEQLEMAEIALGDGFEPWFKSNLSISYDKAKRIIRQYHRDLSKSWRKTKWKMIPAKSLLDIIKYYNV